MTSSTRTTWSTLLLVMAVSSGCAVISEDECQAGLWYERGIEDGARGRSQATVYEIAQKCHEYSVRVDPEAWMRGHEEGVEQYCTPENGFIQGRNGRDYEGVCTGPTADLFMSHYQQGLAVYQAEQQYLAIANRYDSLDREYFRLRAMLDSDLSEEEARGVRMQMRNVRRDMRRLEVEMMRFGGFGSFNPALFY